MLVKVVVMMVTAASCAVAARMRNCVAAPLREERNDGLKWVMSTGTREIGFVSHMAVIQDEQATLEMAWRPRSENIIKKTIRYFR